MCISVFNKPKALFLIFLVASISMGQRSSAQASWQQKANYEIDVKLDDENHKLTGTERITYYNNSPDALDHLYFHLFYNAFQPNSMMDTRSRNIADPDGRVRDRISKLNPNEIGYQKISKVLVNNKEVPFEILETILKVNLPNQIKPKKKAKITLEFEAQIPVQIRRTGRDNTEGIDYTMTQWYPKLCAYDHNGWHPNDYVAREFYGVVGEFEVKITIDKKFIIGATGELENEAELIKARNNPSENMVTWQWEAENVHDFAWAADTDFTHDMILGDQGGKMNFYYQKNSKTDSTWKALQPIMNEVKNFVSERFGPYVYPQFSFIQGGDGGMEYPMVTMMLGNGKFRGLVGLATHEYLHSWYPMMIGTDESRDPWMDEGFASYVETLVMDHLEGKGIFGEIGRKAKDPFYGDYNAYVSLVKSGKEEPLTTPSDHYNTNRAYSIASYVKGALFLNQLEYIIGRDKFSKLMKEYHRRFLHKFASPDDFISLAEKISKMELDWYKEGWVNTTNTIDYSIDTVYNSGPKKTKIILKRIGRISMPIDLMVEDNNGLQKIVHIPNSMAFGHKDAEFPGYTWEVMTPWRWTSPTYSLDLDIDFKSLKSIIIDPSDRMVDIDRTNNEYLPKNP